MSDIARFCQWFEFPRSHLFSRAAIYSMAPVLNFPQGTVPKASGTFFRNRHTLRVWCSATNSAKGPEGAFSPGSEGNARRKLFNRIAPVYDQLNDALSLGQHKEWKKWTVQWSGARNGDEVLDICCGSGDLTFLLADAVGQNGKVVGLDFAAEMLDDARSKELEKNGRNGTDMRWVQGDALDLPFPDSQFDAITMGYGLRNVANIPKALCEINRVLKPGRRAAILDFNNSPNAFVDSFQGFMLENVVVPVARIYGVEEEYEYLRPSIKRFPQGREQERLAVHSGFSSARHYDIMGGLMGVLVAQKSQP